MFEYVACGKKKQWQFAMVSMAHVVDVPIKDSIFHSYVK